MPAKGSPHTGKRRKGGRGGEVGRIGCRGVRQSDGQVGGSTKAGVVLM